MSGLALLGVGAIAGGIASTATSAGAATATTAAAGGNSGSSGPSTSSTVPGSGRQRPGAPPGAAALARHGTLTAVGASSVTIKTSSDTTTYAVTSSSDIEKNGKSALSALAVGDTVAFSTVTTDGTTSIDKLFAGPPPTGMARGCEPGGGGNPGTGHRGPPNGSSGTGSSSSSSSSSSESPA